MYNQYRRVICISNQAEENLRVFLNLNDNHNHNENELSRNICTIYNGVDVEAFCQANPNLSLRNGSRRFVAVMVAGFRNQKDQDTLIKAMTHLDADKFELWLVGDGERRDSLESVVDSIKLRNQVRFFGLRTDIPEILHTADVVVMSSHYEGMSLSAIEGMSVAKPFVASDVDGLREITEGVGLLFPHGDDKALADLIRKLHDDKKLYLQVADACYRKARQFDIRTMAENYHAVYVKLNTNR